MILDTYGTFADAEATGDTGTRVVGDVIDLGAPPPRDIGQGQPMYLMVLVAGRREGDRVGRIQEDVSHRRPARRLRFPRHSSRRSLARRRCLNRLARRHRPAHPSSRRPASRRC